MSRFTRRPSSNTARISPLPPDAWEEEARDVVGRNRAGVGRNGVPNVLATLARHPRLLKAWYGFAAHVIGDSTLPARAREIVILRVALLCRSDYEWAQLVVMARSAGLSDDDIARIRRGPSADGWSSADCQLLHAVDELWTTSTLEDATWKALAERYDERQTLDLLFTIGQYDLLANRPRGSLLTDVRARALGRANGKDRRGRAPNADRRRSRDAQTDACSRVRPRRGAEDSDRLAAGAHQIGIASPGEYRQPISALVDHRGARGEPRISS